MFPALRKTLREDIRRGSALYTAAESVQRFVWKHAPRLFNWQFDKTQIEIDLTTRCNLRCYNCCRAIGLAPSSEFMAVEQIRRFVSESIDARWIWKKIRLMGGEPALHPKLRHVLAVLFPYKKLHPLCDIVIISNGYGEHVSRAFGD